MNAISYQPIIWAGQYYAQSMGSRLTIGPFETLEKCQQVCVKFNLSAEMNRRKNAALDLAMAAGVSDREIFDAIDNDDLLRFESLAADEPVIVLEETSRG